jgi:hypothetical protein
LPAPFAEDGQILPQVPDAGFTDRPPRRSAAPIPSRRLIAGGLLEYITKAVVYRGANQVAVENVPDPKIERPTDAIVV